MKLTTPFIEKLTDFRFNNNTLETSPCGLFRCPLAQVQKHFKLFHPLVRSSIAILEDDWREYEIDIKVHMLMKGQFPCIPNWHCDNIPRPDGDARYDLVDSDSPKMFMWISGNPTTEFLKRSVEAPNMISHDQLANYINNNEIVTEQATENCWMSFDQLTPHRGNQSKENCWRVFARITHRSIAPQRPVNSFIRRHCQVYLDSNKFVW